MDSQLHCYIIEIQQMILWKLDGAKRLIFGAGNINPVSTFLRHSLGVSTEGAGYLLNTLTVLSPEISEDVHLATVFSTVNWQQCEAHAVLTWNTVIDVNFSRWFFLPRMCLKMLGGGSGETWLLSPTAWKEDAARWGTVSPPSQPATSQKDTALSCSRKGLSWTLGRISPRPGDWTREWAAPGGGGATVRPWTCRKRLDLALSAMV